MRGEDAARVFQNQLNSYERDEIKQFEMIYYMNSLTSKPKALANEGKDDESKIFNFGFDTEDGDFLYESGEHINYRYEIMKKLGRGAFGVVLKCLDHMTKEVVALKILKN